MDMLQKITAYTLQEHMLAEGDHIVAGISGGADSVCLFYVLLELQKKYDLSIAVVHVNHGVRADAGEDESFVRKLCEQHDIPYYPFKEDVPGYAKEQHLSEEEAGRMIRYRAFFRVLENVYGGNGKIAVAHTQNDCAETMLFHLFRGSGLNGLCGIVPVRDRIIRPLLCVNRQEIENFLAKRGASYCMDSTNETDEYARNRIRHHILPYVDREICADPVGHLNRTAQQLREAAEYLSGKVTQAAEETVTYEKDSARIAATKWRELHPYLQQEVVHALFKKLTPAAKDITAAHITKVCELFEKQTGRRIDLPYGLCAVRDYDGVLIYRRADADRTKERERTEYKLEGTQGKETYGDYTVSWRVFENTDGETVFRKIPKNDCTKWFDYDRIKQSMTLRYRKTGDFLVINAGGGTKSLKQYMIDEKIPAARRDNVLLLASGQKILWVLGHRISEDGKISSQTRHIIEIQISGGNKNG